jgi:hypothetical protein
MAHITKYLGLIWMLGKRLSQIGIQSVLEFII